ncbi:MAG: MgtC/SapB family protein, partial [Sphaerochaetaceae bacterium]|nr:MgtC/SapB family protein [Sphaerochaetaceae bacterium]
MQLFYLNNIISFENYLDFLLRLIVAIVCGALVGLERERRFKNAGLRTHIIVALAACLMMIVSKYGFMDIVGLDGLRLQVDGSRIAASVVQAIGFIGAGVIYIRKENAVGLTTASGLWATVGIGLAIGAGLYAIGVITTAFILLVQWLLHSYHSKQHSFNVGTLKCNITSHGISFEKLKEIVESYNLTIRDISIVKTSEGVVVTMNVLFKNLDSSVRLIENFKEGELFDSIQ